LAFLIERVKGKFRKDSGPRREENDVEGQCSEGNWISVGLREKHQGIVNLVRSRERWERRIGKLNRNSDSSID